jgi:hypothetical protein
MLGAAPADRTSCRRTRVLSKTVRPAPSQLAERHAVRDRRHDVSCAQVAARPTAWTSKFGPGLAAGSRTSSDCHLLGPTPQENTECTPKTAPQSISTAKLNAKRHGTITRPRAGLLRCPGWQGSARVSSDPGPHRALRVGGERRIALGLAGNRGSVPDPIGDSIRRHDRLLSDTILSQRGYP